MIKRFAGLLSIMALCTLLAPMVTGCPAQVTDDNIQRCCICMTDAECLDDGVTTAVCRQDISNDGTTDYDATCQLDYCFNECEFL